MALTEVKIRNARPDERPVRLWDSGGLYLEISPSGGKLWRFKYRYLGKEKLLALGKWNATSLSQARKARDQAKELLAIGQDPAQAKQEAKRKALQGATNLFETVAREWYGRQSHIWFATVVSDEHGEGPRAPRRDLRGARITIRQSAVYVPPEMH